MKNYELKYYEIQDQVVMWFREILHVQSDNTITYNDSLLIVDGDDGQNVYRNHVRLRVKRGLLFHAFFFPPNYKKL